jgi:Tol biopolymer transport system component
MEGTMSHRGICAGLAVILAALFATPALATPPGRNGMIVWQQESARSPVRLWVANPDGSGARQVFRGSSRQAEFEGTFSTMEPNVVFFSRGAHPFRPFSEDIYRGDLATGAVTRVLGAKTADIAPTVSPDGARLAYFAVTRARLDEDAPPPPQRIHVANVDGTADHAVTPRGVLALDPDWSPDGTRIAYTEARVVGDRADNRLMIVNADGTGRRALTQYRGRNEINPKWTPDGQTIVFEHLREPGRRSSIMAMPSAGGSPRVVYDSAGWDTNPIPSPDGTRILFTSDRHRPARDRINPRFELYTMAVDGSDVVRLTNNRRIDFFPDWQRLR